MKISRCQAPKLGFVRSYDLGVERKGLEAGLETGI
jgi:hypothetical protein